MDINKIIKAKHKESLASQSVVEPKSKLELGTQPQKERKTVGQLQKEIESIVQTSTNPELAEYLSPLETTQRVDSIFESGWEYTQLLKEFRENY